MSRRSPSPDAAYQREQRAIERRVRSLGAGLQPIRPPTFAPPIPSRTDSDRNRALRKASI